MSPSTGSRCSDFSGCGFQALEHRLIRCGAWVQSERLKPSWVCSVEKREVEGFLLRRPLPWGPQTLVQGGAPADTRPEMPHELLAWLLRTSCVPALASRAHNRLVRT